MAAVSACSDKAKIDGVLTGAPESEVIVKKLSPSGLSVLDTLKTDSDGGYSYGMEVKEGNPEFVYLYKGDVKLASLILQTGDKVRVVSDTLGSYSVEGSEESEKLRGVEQDFNSFLLRFASAIDAGDQAKVSKEYIDYYRSRVKYVLENSRSITVVPVLYQKVNENFPIFSQTSDAIIFQNIHDSLALDYPNSEYVAALGKEAERRFNILNLEHQMQNAGEMSYPDLDLPSVDGTKKKLSEVESKAVLIYFWTASDASQKMFNQETLLPLYRQYHDKGLEVYAVSLDTDKGVWADAVRDQKLPWINVCDGLGAASPAVLAYNLTKGLPVAYLLVNDEFSGEAISDDASLRKALAKNL